jgi:hypothetical protein
MTSQPSIFIGSATEHLDYANALQRVLDRDLVTTVWSYGVFSPGGYTLASLIARAEVTDFAAIFLTPDDESVVRGEYLRTPRDNLVFELGLFIGRLGPERVFLLSPRDGVDLPSDLQGVTPITYRTDREDEDTQNAVNPAATDIRNAVKRLGRLPRSRPDVGPSAGPPLAETLLAIGRLGDIAGQSGAQLSIRREGGRFEVGVVDGTRLGTSVVVDLNDAAAVRAIDRLCESLASADT